MITAAKSNGRLVALEAPPAWFLTDQDVLAEARRLIRVRAPLIHREDGDPVRPPSKRATRAAWQSWHARLAPANGTSAPTVLGRIRQVETLSADAVCVLATLVVLNTEMGAYRKLPDVRPTIGLLVELLALPFDTVYRLVGVRGELVEPGIIEAAESHGRSAYLLDGTVAISSEVLRALRGAALTDDERWSLSDAIRSAISPNGPSQPVRINQDSDQQSPEPVADTADCYRSEADHFQDRLRYLQAIADVRSAEEAVRDPSALARLTRDREPEAQLRIATSRLAAAKRRIAHRLVATERSGHKIPELESFCREVGLTELERDIVLALIAADLRPEFRNSLVGHMQEFPQVRDLVSFLSNDIEGQIGALRLFTSNATLRREAIIEFDGDAAGSLSNVSVQINRQIQGRLLGYQPNEGILDEGLALIPPAHGWADVVLPDDLKDLIARLILGSEGIATALEVAGLGRHIPYGRAPGIVFTGGPGVGKTYTAEACASLLGKRVLRARCDRLTPYAVSSLGREARMSGAILLLEEVDGLFGDRDLVGGVRALLTDIERSREPFIATTNRSFSFDEAFKRRVLFVRLPAPDARLREQLWTQLLPPSLPFDQQPDRAELAARYDFTGGEIKTIAVGTFMSGRADNSCLMLRQRDLQAFIKSTAEAKRDGGTSETGFRSA